MNIEPDNDFRAKILERIVAREFKERTGTHCTDLLYCLNKSALRRIYPKPITDDMLLLFSLGWATQRWLTGQDKDKPEKEADGIIVTLDATEMGVVPWELKATYQSSRRLIEENVSWFRQIMAQCYVTAEKVAYLSRLEIMGDWKSIFGKKEEKEKPEHRKPTLHVWRLTFTPDELRANWAWLKYRKVLFEQVLRTGELLPKAQAIPSGQEYECQRCEYRGEECKL